MTALFPPGQVTQTLHSDWLFTETLRVHWSVVRSACCTLKASLLVDPPTVLSLSPPEKEACSFISSELLGSCHSASACCLRSLIIRALVFIFALDTFNLAVTFVGTEKWPWFAPPLPGSVILLRLFSYSRIVFFSSHDLYL